MNVNDVEKLLNARSEDNTIRHSTSLNTSYRYNLFGYNISLKHEKWPVEFNLEAAFDDCQSLRLLIMI